MASTLVFAFYELARDPSHQDKLLLELDGVNMYDRVGQNLALSELRFVIALLVQKFRVGFALGEEALFADLRDQFTAAPGNLQLQLSLRESS